MQVLQNNISGGSRLTLKAAEDVTGQSPAAKCAYYCSFEEQYQHGTIREESPEETWFSTKKKKIIIHTIVSKSTKKIKCK